MDMVVFPVLWSLLQTTVGTGLTQWNPLTLQGAGLFHIAMGAVLGIAAFGRTQEKLGGANNGGAQVPSSGFTAPSTPSSGFGAASGGFGSATSTAVSPTPSWGTTPTATATSSFGGGAGIGATAPTTPAVTTPSTPTSTFALSDTAAEPTGATMGIKRPQI
jgi:hypothetical protein